MKTRQLCAQKSVFDHLGEWPCYFRVSHVVCCHRFSLLLACRRALCCIAAAFRHVLLAASRAYEFGQLVHTHFACFIVLFADLIARGLAVFFV